MVQQAVVPTIITYAALISACQKSKESEQALEIFVAMSEQRMVPNAITYNAMMTACEKSQRPEQALKAFVSMEQ